MEDFLQLCEDTKKKLGRQLQEKEKEFLTWVYESHEQEKQKERRACKTPQRV